MKKVSKIMFLVCIALIIIATALTNVAFADTTQIVDTDGYVDLDEVNKEDDKKTENTDNKTNGENESTTENKTDDQKEDTANKSDVAEENHPQAGSENYIVYISIASVIVVGIAFIKMKKYNF